MTRSRRSGRRRSGGRKRESLPFDGVRTATVTALGLGGDGLADLDGHRLFIPMTVPGERVSIRAQSKRGAGWLCQIEALEQASAQRIEPVCSHFHDCGGCALQHLNAQTYQDFKRNKVLGALSRQGFDTVSVHDYFAAGAGARRRATFGFLKTKDRALFGFHRRSQHDIVDVMSCPVVTPGLQAILEPMRAGLAQAVPPGQRLQVQVQWFDRDVWDLVITATTALDQAQRLSLITMAQGLQDLGLGRICWRWDGDMTPEVLLSLRPCEITWAGQAVTVPPGAFMQPTGEGEAYLQRYVVDHLRGCKVVADLFCGLGTFAIPLSQGAKVYAADIDADQTQALKQAGGRVRTESRDLAKRPLMPDELKAFDGLVFDPPRKGASAQCEMIAQAARKGFAPRTIVAVSCDADSFARDARILRECGYQLTNLSLVDQFTWSAHVEIAGQFQKRSGC